MSDEKDIFELPELASLSKCEPKKEAPTTTNSPIKPMLGPVHFGGAAALAAIVWIAWPFVVGSSNAEGRVTQSMRTEPTRTAAPAPSQRSEEVPYRDPAEVLRETEPTKREIELQGRVDDLQARVLSVEDRILIQTQPVATETLRPTVKVKRVIKAVPKKAPEPDILTGFAVNTIYRNQAWLQKGDVTYLVQSGDAIEGVRIVSVDARLRQVLTDHGLIR